MPVNSAPVRRTLTGMTMAGRRGAGSPQGLYGADPARQDEHDHPGEGPSQPVTLSRWPARRVAGRPGSPALIGRAHLVLLRVRPAGVVWQRPPVEGRR